jgi:hypothetical protein
MAIFIGDKPAQMLQQTGQTIQNIQKEYETEKLRREEYVDQYDAAESDYATVKAEFKPILSKYVDDILKAQTAVEETNSPEARERLRNLSRDYQRVKAISEAQSQAITKGLADARSGNYYQTEDEVAAQVKESLADLAGMSGEQLLNSKYADPNFIMFQATPYDKAVDMIDVTKYSDRAAKIVGNQVGRIYDSSGRLKVDEARASLGEQADLLYKSSPQALKAAAYMYADQKHPDGINAVQAILENPEMMAEAKEMYKQAYIESALPMITDKIAVDKGEGDKELDLFPVREFGGGNYDIRLFDESKLQSLNAKKVSLEKKLDSLEKKLDAEDISSKERKKINQQISEERKKINQQIAQIENDISKGVVSDRVIGNVDKVITIDDNNKIVITGAGTMKLYRKEKTLLPYTGTDSGKDGEEEYVFKEVSDMSNFVAKLPYATQKKFQKQFGSGDFKESKYTVKLPEIDTE